MIDSSWHIEEPAPDEVVAVGAPGTLVTLHFIRSALRRRWRVWGAFACLGMLLGLVWTVAIPAKSVGTATLLLAHDPTTDPDQAMSTDVSLLRTRTLAAAVIDQLGLKMTPEAFQKSVTPTPVSSSVLVLDVSAPDDRAAVTRARALAAGFLRFRTTQIHLQSKALVDGYGGRVAQLQKQADSLTRQYNSLGATPAGRSQAADVLAQRSQVNAEISTFQQTIQDTALKTNSIVAASHVLDEAGVAPHSAKKRVVLAVGSGMIAGTAMGMGFVLFTALTSERLRRRDEVAAALGAPVRVSVGALRRGRLWSRLPGHRSDSERDVQVLVHGLESLTQPRKRTSRKTRPPGFALATLGDAHLATVVLASLAARLSRRGMAPFVVDLTESGRLEDALKDALGRHSDDKAAQGPSPTVYRPDGIPFLAHGPVGATGSFGSDLGQDDPRRSAWDSADVVLVLADLDPAVGVDYLNTWTDEVVLLVAAGESSAERLRTTAELIRSADLALPFAMMVGVDQTDESLGVPEALEAAWRDSGQTP